MIHEAIRDYLRADNDIRDRVDKGMNNPGIYASTVPASHRGESIVLQKIFVDRSYHLRAEAGKTRALVQITCYAASPARAESLAELVRNRLSGYQGNAGTANPIYIDSAIIDNEPGHSSETPIDGSDNWFHSYTVEYGIMHTTSIPTLV